MINHQEKKKKNLEEGITLVDAVMKLLDNTSSCQVHKKRLKVQIKQEAFPFYIWRFLSI